MYQVADMIQLLLDKILKIFNIKLLMIYSILNKFVIYKNLIRRIYLDTIIKSLKFKIFIISSNNWVIIH